MICAVVGRYGIDLDKAGGYVTYREPSDAQGCFRIISISGIEDVINRRRSTTPVYLYNPETDRSLKEAAATHTPVAKWAIKGVAPESLYGEVQEGMYLIGDDSVCIVSSDLEIALIGIPGDGMEQGIDGLLLETPHPSRACTFGMQQAS
ncbi:MAG: hypothetical protein WCR85_00350 [Sphaerochaeta sp.]